MDIICLRSGRHFASSEDVRACENTFCHNGESCPYVINDSIPHWVKHNEDMSNVINEDEEPKSIKVEDLDYIWKSDESIEVKANIPVDIEVPKANIEVPRNEIKNNEPDNSAHESTGKVWFYDQYLDDKTGKWKSVNKRKHDYSWIAWAIVFIVIGLVFLYLYSQGIIFVIW
jgi:hypothetical protein